MYEQFTNDVRKVMQTANKEAHLFNHDYVGTEHILLGLLRVHEDIAAQVLIKLGLNLDDVRQAVLRIDPPPLSGGS